MAGVAVAGASSLPNPTEVMDEYWVWADNKSSKNNRKPEENCGKWLIFEPESAIDKVWSTIREITEKGELGFQAKVSTRMGKEENSGLHQSTSYVICVYTYDYEDKEDVMRVRERLREVGFHRKLPYKTDAATLAGQYRKTTGKPVSKYYC